MEQFVLGIFQEQLAKYIIGFRKEQVNANLLNGKGEITDIELNCAVLNDTLTRMTPFVELERVHCRRLSFHVTSWANLRKAPIVVDVQDVSVTLVEPLHYHDRSQQKRIRQILVSELIERIRQGLQGTRGPYNLFDRILDNLNLDVSSVKITFRPIGKFKTRRLGPWTPPGFQLSLTSVRLVSVNEFGCEATPDECWRHNHHHHHHHGHRDGSILIYKKMTMEYQLSLLPTDRPGPGDDEAPPPPAVPLVQGLDNQMEVQLVLQRRVRDAAILAVQVDCVIPSVEVNVPQRIIPDLAHALAGLQYCFAKDRHFVDPLKPAPAAASESLGAQQAGSDVRVTWTSNSSGDLLNAGVEDDAIDKGDSNESDLADGLSSSSSSEDESENDVGLNPMPDDTQATAPSAKSTASTGSDVSASTATEGSMSAAETLASRLVTAGSSIRRLPSASASASATTPPRLKIPHDRPVILLPNGVVIYDKVSLSVAMHNAVVRGTYAEEAGHIQLIGKGCIVEAIWPKFNQQKGGYLQASVAYVSMQERFGSRIRTLLVGGGGAQREMQNDGPLEAATRTGKEVRRDESFPMYEDRCVRPDPTGLRYTYPEQAFGVKMTVDYVKKLSADESLPIEEREDVSVLHELGMEHFDVVFDSLSWCRAVRYVFDERHGGFDSRWHSGDWGEFITSDMLVSSAANSLILEDFLQPSKQLFLDENEFPSSDLFNVTARIKNVEVRVPAALLDDVRSCDIVLKLGEAMLVVSSALPRTFLSGKLGSSVNGDEVDEKGLIDFPNDPSDVAYVLERSEDPSNRQRGIPTTRAISTFRLQLTLRGAAIHFQHVVSMGPYEDHHELLAPTELTLILCFEGEPPGPECSLTKVVVFLSVLAHVVGVNIDLELLTSAIGTLASHFQELASTVAFCQDVLQPSSLQDVEVEQSRQSDERILKSFSGRRVLVRRQIRQSRATGGVSVAFGLQSQGINITLWRQNVPRGSPTHAPVPSTSTKSVVPLLKLLSIEVSTVEVGVEGSFRQSNRRVVGKLCLSSMEVRGCDLTDLARHPDSTPSNGGESSLICIARLGGDPADGCALRIEECLYPIRTWTLAGDLDSGLELCCRVEVLEGVALLILETLLLPAWCNVGAFLDQRSCDVPWSFPAGSIGALFLSISCALVPNIGEASIIGLEISEDAETQQVPGGVVDKVLRGLIEKAIPKDVMAILVRLASKNVRIRIPLARASSRGYGLFIERANVLVSFFSSNDACETPCLKILGAKQKDWSAIVATVEKGLFHSLVSAQKLCLWDSTESVVLAEETLVDVFEFGYTYAKAKAFLSMKNNITVESIERMDAFLLSMKQFLKACAEIASTTSHALSAVRQTRRSNASRALGRRSDPVELACSNVVASIRMTRESLLQTNAACLRHQVSMQEMRKLLYDELSKLKVVLFKKERERLNALALVSSQVAGWLRIGSSQRVGQRGMMSWNLWPSWAVLRRSLLLLYSSPTQTSASSVINLHNASLRALAGGRKRDVNRAFAIVESTGAVHLVVAATDREYATWVSGLHRITQSTDSSIISLIASSHDEYGDDSANTSVDQSEGGRARRSVGIGLTKAVNAAKVTGRVVKATGLAVVDRSRRIREHSGTHYQEGSEEGSEDPEFASTEGSSREEGEHSTSLLGEDDASAQSRRLQLRSRLSGVGQVTKTRFGSAFQAARQKGREVTESRKMRMASSASTENNWPVTAEDESKSSTSSVSAVARPVGGWWSCTACGSVNKHPRTDCEKCGTSISGKSPGIEPSVESQSVPGVHGADNGETDRAAMPPAASASPSQQEPQELDLFGATGSVASTNGTTASTIDETDRTIAPPSIRVNNVGIGGQLLVPSSSNHRTDPDVGVPSRRLAGCWMVRVEPIVNGSDRIKDPRHSRDGLESAREGENERTSGHATESEPKTDHDANEGGEETALGGEEINPREGRGGAGSSSGDGGTDEGDSTIEQLIIASSFRILVYRTGPSGGFQQAAEVSRSLPDVLGLHTTVSESLGSQPGPWMRDDGRDPRTGEMTDSLAARLGLTAWDMIRLTGQALGALLHISARCSTKEFLELCCDGIRECVNSMLDASLPMEGLAALVDFLSIKDFSTILPRAEFQPSVERTGPDLDLTDRDLLALSDATAKLLVRAESQSVLAERLALSVGRKSTRNLDGWMSASPNPAVLSYEPGNSRFREAMYGTLTKVMEERDEAQARMVAAGVLHAHEMDQQRKVVRRLELEVETLKSSSTRHLGGGTTGDASSDGSAEVRRAARALQQESEAELLSLCQQLASEISSRTSASLEIVRLRESRDLERENERMERQSLEDELHRTREQLAAEQAKLDRSRRESSNWKESYEEVLVHGSETASEHADETN